MSDFYSFKAMSNKGEEIAFDQYKNKVLLIVNTASKCGFTPQYEGLQTLYKKYQDQGLEILAFPCDQFAHQEPGSDQEIQQFCSLNYNVSFPLFKKIEVNGDNTPALYQFLKEKAPGLFGSKSIKWNFTKFLVNKQGDVLERYAPKTTPEKIEDDIRAALNA